MKLVELETAEVRRDPRAALQRAIDDVPAAESAHKEAERLVEECEVERQRLLKLWRVLNDGIREAGAKLAAAKRAWLESAVAEHADAKALRECREHRERRQALLDQLNFLTAWAQSDNESEQLRARIAERGAFADLQESRATRQRLGMISGASAGAAYDPGAVIAFPDDAWSTRIAKEAVEIRSMQIKGLEADLARHLAAIEASRAAISINLFS